MKLENRISKYETIPKPKIKNEVGLDGFGILGFEFVSDFVFRICIFIYRHDESEPKGAIIRTRHVS